MRFRALDGFRAIAIMLVIFSHAIRYGNLPIDISFFGNFMNFGRLGVQIFFVLSGFLITGIFLKTENINLKEFYLKRALRIFPAFYFFISVIIVISYFLKINLKTNETIHALTYTANYLPRYIWSDTHWYLGHSWSLSVEEQFYILWPFFLALLGFSHGYKVALALIVLCPLVRGFYGFGSFVFPNINNIELYQYLTGCIMFSFESIGDALATGCLLAIFKEKLLNHRMYRSVLFSNLFPWLSIAILIFIQLLGGSAIRAYLYNSYIFKFAYYLFGFSITNVIIGMIIHWLLLFPAKPISLVLTSKPFVAIGTLSYSLYLWQQPFFYHELNFFTIFPYNLLLTFVCALFSYYIIEKPFLRLKERLFPAIHKKCNET